MAASRRSLVLHFDINKTIIMCDPVKGVGCDRMVNSILSECCWGKWEEGGDKLKAAASWKFEAGPTSEPQPGLTTYADLLEEILKVDKATRVSLKTSFTDPGNPGEQLRGAYADLYKQLELPESVKLPFVPAAVGPRHCFIVPSFLEMVKRLHADGRDFRVVFRTFGVDLPEVLTEWNAFCNGEHPCHEVPASMKQRAVETPSGTGEWYRDAAATHLALCVNRSGKSLCTMVHGYAECAAALKERLFGEAPTYTLALRDHYGHWRDQDESSEAGKTLPVEDLSDAGRGGGQRPARAAGRPTTSSSTTTSRRRTLTSLMRGTPGQGSRCRSPRRRVCI
eukprot:TRINITY_DN16465_c0_g1_i2.p2 TRINITY_DN16465_c0_g1~~TRINITY_DN16465_c0_g1_i2.p2  ORF type:complete len:357 (+),score=95.69 TRINITY_DN16465_c0_g1_i2:63-1073(+)